MAEKIEEEQPEVPQKLSLAEKIAGAISANHDEHVVDEMPTSPSSVPGGRGRGRNKARLGTIVNKTPFHT